MKVRHLVLTFLLCGTFVVVSEVASANCADARSRYHSLSSACEQYRSGVDYLSNKHVDACRKAADCQSRYGISDKCVSDAANCAESGDESRRAESLRDDACRKAASAEIEADNICRSEGQL